MTTKKSLPIGISSIDTLLAEDCLYIDKTENIHRLITTGKRYFLARPRRFGKSLLVSTFKEIFSGNKALFKDCWIGQEERYTWKEHPVVVIDFSVISKNSPESLEEDLATELDMIGKSHGIKLSGAKSLNSKITLLIRTLAEREKVVVLIDEYDAAILNHVDNHEFANKMRDILRELYSCFKGLDMHLHFLFLTGITKFSKASIFSGLNNLKDISLSPSAAALCGYTEEEIRSNFADYIQDFAAIRRCSNEDIMNEMRIWYNGYRFSSAEIKVYNPFSVFHYLDEQRPGNYWFDTGTPTFLVELIKKHPAEFNSLDHSTVSETTISQFNIETLSLPTTLYQTGYLTIEDYNEANRTYRLTYPNQEVQESLTECLVTDFIGGLRQASNDAASQLRRALNNEDLGTFCEILNSLFAQIPYQINIKQEAYYHALMQMICSMIGLETVSEVSTNKGRIDLILQTKTTIYICELKLDKKPVEALAQIKENCYAEPYRASGKKIYLVGLAFSYDDKKLGFMWEEYKRN